MAISDDEILCCDWSKHSENIVATGGSDSMIRGWDLRNFKQPLFQILDHGHAVKKLKFSPFHPTTLASASYDTTVRYRAIKLKSKVF